MTRTANRMLLAAALFATTEIAWLLAVVKPWVMGLLA